MNRSKIIEVMASGICGPGAPCESCRNSAERALSALQANGLAVVPVSEVQYARDAVEDWAGYADDYFKKRHDLAGDLARINAMLTASNFTKEESDE